MSCRSVLYYYRTNSGTSNTFSCGDNKIKESETETKMFAELMTPKVILAAFISSILVSGFQCVDIPNCDFFDTVKINGRFSNGSYKYNDLVVPAHLTGEYDYVINFDGEREPAPKHIRGCVCKLRTCIRFCCDSKKMMTSDGMGCSDYINDNLTYVNFLNITKSDGKTVEEKDIKEVMIVQDELPLPCKEVYRLLPEEDERDKWTLFENGTIYRHYDAKMLSKLEYCLQPDELGEDYSVSLVAFNCIIKPSLVTAYVKICSTFFISLIIFVYLWQPRFRSLHGRICNLYFICLPVTFLLNVMSMFRTFEGRPLLCDINGYAGYFMVIATFMWLSVVSFDVWRRFTARQFQDFYDNGRSSFFNYNAIVWITTSILTISIILVDKFVEFDGENSYIPGVGLYSCWINMNNWTAMIYLYSPLTILTVLNGVMYGLTARYIYVENKRNQNELNRIAEQRIARNRANYRVYLRLFIVMGGSWFLEVLGYILDIYARRKRF